VPGVGLGLGLSPAAASGAMRIPELGWPGLARNRRPAAAAGITPIPPAAGPAGLMQVRKARQQPCPAAGAPALDRALGDPEDLGGVGDRIVEHVDENQGYLLIVRQMTQGRHDLHRQIAAVRRVGRGVPRRDHVEQALVAPSDLGPHLPPTHTVKAGIHHNTVQPCRYSRLAAEARRAPERRDHRVLQCVGRFLRVGERPDRDRPQPLPVPDEQLAEGIRVAIDVQAQQRGVAEPGTDRFGPGAALTIGRRAPRSAPGASGCDLRLTERRVARGRAAPGGQPPAAAPARVRRFRRPLPVLVP